MFELTQENIPAKLTTPLGEDTLALSAFNISEGLSQLFEIRIETLSENSEVNFDDAIGRSCTVELRTPDNKIRYFTGLLTEARWTGGSEDLSNYNITLRPWLWLLASRSNCRIFIEKKVDEIIDEVLGDAGFQHGEDYQFRLSDDLERLSYCVQFRETDLTFISRLMEKFGLFYFFEHTSLHHQLVIVDGVSNCSPNEDVPELSYNIGMPWGDTQYLQTWISERIYNTGHDYDYLEPAKKLIANKLGAESYEYSDFEIYDFPGKYTDVTQGEKFARIRLEAEQAFDHRRFSDGIAPSIYPGCLVSVEEHPRQSENTLYLVVKCEHSYGAQYYRSGGPGASPALGYRGNFEFLPANQQFRALPLTPRPRISGIQTALVVGKAGQEDEEISTDEHGRVFVQFYWDRNKTTSCPVRVAQALAGNKWGEIFLPRVGMEVVVEYLEGDPDYPLIVGTIYNGSNKTPYELPSEKTKSGWKTRSSKHSDGFNEISFEDKTGGEVINVHAQNDLSIAVLNDRRARIDGNDSIVVGCDEKGGEYTLTAFEKATINVGPTEAPPLTQIVMDTTSVTLNVGPGGMATQIVMNMTGITLSVGPGGTLAQIVMGPTGVTISGTPASQLMVQPTGIMTATPMMNLTYGPVTFVSPLVTIPVLTGATPAGVPII
jgi:type VI secretion system secreted protein VgrG